MRMLSQTLNGYGYPTVGYLVDGKQKLRAVHLLIADAFLPEDRSRPTVNHKDHNRSNNKLENLEHASSSEQNAHKRKPVGGRAGQPIFRISVTGNDTVRYKSIVKAAAAVEGSVKNVARAARKGTACSGYLWRYETDADTQIQGEEWRSLDSRHIRGIEGCQISSAGRIRNSSGRIKPQQVPPGTYPQVGWGTGTFYVHRLVALTFCPNPQELKIVNHINGIKGDARADNLEWVSLSENAQHALRTGLRSSLAVLQYDTEGILVASYPSIVLAQRKTGIDMRSISRVCRGDGRHAGGFFWVFAT